MVGVGGGLAGALAFSRAGWTESPPVPAHAEVVATGVPRPLQLAVDGATLVVLSPGVHGAAAGEIYRFAVDGELPVDLSRQPRILIPFVDSGPAALGSLAIDPVTRAIFLGEENGTRVYRLGDDGRLTTYAVGLRRLSGGGTLAFDREGRLLVLDYVDPSVSPADDRIPFGLEQFRDEDYRGPLVFRLALDPTIPLPRRLSALAPFFPRGWGGRRGGASLPHLIAVAVPPAGDLVFLGSTGTLFRLASDGVLERFARLPVGQYNRTTMAAARDGTVFVSGGFQMSTVLRVAPGGAVTTVATNLADPEGLALDARDNLYVAESSYHRILRFRPASFR